MNNKKYDFYKHYKFFENKEILFSFNGKFSGSILQSIITILEEKLSDYNVEINNVKRIVSIIIELTQNIQRYSHHKTVHNNREKGHGILVVRKIKENFEIYAGNVVTREKGKELIRYYNTLKNQSQESLKELYMKKLKEKRASECDSAGIGLMHILRKSNSRMEITLHKIDGSLAFLVFSLLVN